MPRVADRSLHLQHRLLGPRDEVLLRGYEFALLQGRGDNLQGVNRGRLARDTRGLSNHRGSHVGIRAMCERQGQLGGKMNIHPAAGAQHYQTVGVNGPMGNLPEKRKTETKR